MVSVPTYSAGPISNTFLLVRIMQGICMITIIGMAANFVAMINGYGIEPPQEFVGTLSVTCLATLYCLVSISFYWSEAYLGLLVMTGVDFLLLIAFIVVAVTVGKPVSFMNCYAVKRASASANAEASYAFTVAVAQSLNADMPAGMKVNAWAWAGATKSNCLQTKTIWGLSIALCLLFTTSAALLPTLFYKNKKSNGPAAKADV